MAFCKVMIIGNLGRDPEMRYTPNGKPGDPVQRRGQPEHARTSRPASGSRSTDWFRVSVLGDRAERAAEQLRKGNRVFVEGRFRTREFEGKDGQKRTSLDVTADNVISLEKRRATTTARSPAPRLAAGAAGAACRRCGGRWRRRSRPPADDTDLDDLPF